MISSLLKIVTSVLPALFAVVSLSGQDAKWDFRARGYVKNLQIWSTAGAVEDLVSGGFFHHRLELGVSDGKALGWEVALRNRIFYGEYLRVQGGFAQALDRDNGLVDLSFVPYGRSSLVASSVIDRLFMQYRKGRWEWRLGRQRINWGMALIWNPNDWFNAYNFLDFDYEERPGADAFRLRYGTGDFGALELAWSPARRIGESIAALRYGDHVEGLDWQVLAGYYRDRLAAGFGMAADAGGSGLKGEASVFAPLDRDSLETVLSLAFGIDHMFGNQWFCSAGFLVNTNGEGGDIGIEALNRTTLSPVNLMPGKFSGVVSVQHPFTALSGFAFSAVYSPNGHLLIAIPSLNWSVAENWDLDLTGQLFWLRESGKAFENAGNGIYLRARWSY